MDKNIGQKAYELLLKDPRWSRKSYYIKKRDHERCVICGETQKLNVHHTNYGDIEKPWDVPNEWLITLCEGCHKKVHNGKLSIDYPQMGKFYKSEHGIVGIVCKIDKQSSHVIMLSQNLQKENKPTLTKIRIAYFCRFYKLLEHVEQSVANWFYLNARDFTADVKTMKEYAVSEISQNCAVDDFEDCYITDAEIAYTRKVLVSYLNNFTIPAVRPKIGQFYCYEHSDYWNTCLCVHDGNNLYDDYIYLLEYDCGSNGIWIGRYLPYHFFKLQCQTFDINDLSGCFWKGVADYMLNDHFALIGNNTPLTNYEHNIIKQRIKEMSDNDIIFKTRLNEAKEALLYR